MKKLQLMVVIPRRIRRAGWAVAASASICVTAGAAPGAASGDQAACPNAAIRAQQQTEALPDCRALELVTPPLKGGGAASVHAVAASGDAIAFTSSAAFGDPPSIGPNNWYLARRGASGWESASRNLPTSAARLVANDLFEPYMTPDLSQAFFIGLSPAEKVAGQAGLFTMGPDGATARTGSIRPSVVPAFTPWDVLGASTDLSHVVVHSFRGSDVQLVGGEPTVAGELGGYHIWEAVRHGSSPYTYRLIDQGNDGRAIGGACGAYFGGRAYGSSTSSTMQGAIARDGSTIYFASFPTEVDSEYCYPDSSVPLPTARIFARIGGTQTVQVSQSECDRAVPDPNPAGIEACSETDGNDVFQGASVDGSRAFFTSPRQLTNSDQDDGGQDLYLYDAGRETGARLVHVSRGTGQPGTTDGDGADVQGGVVRISDDGSRAYFVARGVLTTSPNARGGIAQDGDHNLYVFRAGAGQSAGSVAFVGKLDPRDETGLWSYEAGFSHQAYAVPRLGVGGPDTGGNGHTLVFQSYGRLTEDDEDDAVDVYRYDDRVDRLDRISVAGPGAPAQAGNGETNATFTAQFHAGATPQVAMRGRPVTEDGNSVVFKSVERLDGGDGNDVQDAYLWRDGRVQRLSLGTSAAGVGAGNGSASTVLTITASGDEATFETTDRLLPQDVDRNLDVYAARVDGGFSVPAAPPAPCVGEDCQRPPVPQPAPSVAASVTFTGPGDEAPGGAGAVKPKVARVKVVRGTQATLRVKLAGRGRLKTTGSGLVRTSRSVSKAGTYAVKVRLSKRARATLARNRRLTVTVRVTFAQRGGEASTARVRLTFRSAARPANTKGR